MPSRLPLAIFFSALNTANGTRGRGMVVTETLVIIGVMRKKRVLFV